jgi:hypothetical protein
MMQPVNRRILVGAGPLALASCASASAYLGTANSPRAQCERLLRALPMPPLYYNVQAVRKAFMCRLAATKRDSVRFKYAWIETQWGRV